MTAWYSGQFGGHFLSLPAELPCVNPSIHRSDKSTGTTGRVRLGSGYPHGCLVRTVWLGVVRTPSYHVSSRRPQILLNSKPVQFGSMQLSPATAFASPSLPCCHAPVLYAPNVHGWACFACSSCCCWCRQRCRHPSGQPIPRIAPVCTTKLGYRFMEARAHCCMHALPPGITRRIPQWGPVSSAGE